VQAEELAAFKPLLLRRAAREPLQYIVGRTAFRELVLKVDRRALIPRPETEELVQVVLDWARRRATGSTAAQPVSGSSAPESPHTLTAADIGTGTGCIALSLAQEGPFRRVLATDASAAALELATENARSVGVHEVVELRVGNLLEPLAYLLYLAAVFLYAKKEKDPGRRPLLLYYTLAFALMLVSTVFVQIDGPDTIFLLTDGNPSSGKLTEMDDLRDEVIAWNLGRAIRINCVNVGDTDARLLRALAYGTGGVFVDLKSDKKTEEPPK
jgi:hypothetical protein